MKTLVFNPEVFIFSDVEAHLLYNSKTNKKQEIIRTPFWDKVISYLNNVSSLYRYSISDSEYEYHCILLNTICSNGFARLFNNEETLPFSYPPILKMDMDLPTIKYRYENGEGGMVLSFVRTIVLILDGKLSPSRILPFLRALEFCPVTRVEIQLNSPNDAQLYFSVFRIINTVCNNVHCFVDYSRWDDSSLISFSREQPNWSFHLTGYVSCFITYKGPWPFVLYTRNEIEHNHALQLNAERIIPEYDGHNYNYLKEVLFTKSKDQTISHI